MSESSEFSQAKQFLTQHVFATLATIGAQSHTPQVAYVFYWYDNRNHIYVATLSESRKVTNIESNASVALAIGSVELAQTIQIEGHASIVEEKEEVLMALENIHKRIKEHKPHMILWPMLQLRPHEITIIKLSLSWFRFSSFRDPVFVIEGSSSDLLTS